MTINRKFDVGFGESATKETFCKIQPLSMSISTSSSIPIKRYKSVNYDLFILWVCPVTDHRKCGRRNHGTVLVLKKVLYLSKHRRCRIKIYVEIQGLL